MCLSLQGDSRDISSTQLIAIFLEILLVPHLVVAMYTLTGLQSELFLSLIILLHCIVATLREVKNLRNKLRTRPAQGQTSIWYAAYSLHTHTHTHTFMLMQIIIDPILYYNVH